MNKIETDSLTVNPKDLGESSLTVLSWFCTAKIIARGKSEECSRRGDYECKELDTGRSVMIFPNPIWELKETR